MLRIDESIMINRAPEDVFAYVENLENDPIWQSGVVEAEYLDPGENRVGRRGRVVFRFLGKRLEFTGETTVYDPPKQLAVKTVDGPFDVEQVDRVEAEGDGCRLTIIYEFPRGLGGFFGKLADPLVTKLAARDGRADLEKLRDILEAEVETQL
jgi:ribosome-associated toxin RatA of RatAB toxin-antitoxin module